MVPCKEVSSSKLGLDLASGIKVVVILAAMGIYIVAYERATAVTPLREWGQLERIAKEMQQRRPARQSQQLLMSAERDTATARRSELARGGQGEGRSEARQEPRSLPPVRTAGGGGSGPRLTPFSSFRPPAAEAVEALTWEAQGCRKVSMSTLVSVVNSDRFVKEDDMTPERCAGICMGLGERTFIITSGNMCGCTRDASAYEEDVTRTKCPIGCAGNTAVPCGGKGWWSNVFAITSEQREIITIYVAPAMRTSSLFQSGRLARYFSGRYQYVTKALNARLQGSKEAWRKTVCEDNPGKKIFVQVQSTTSFLLGNFPSNSIFVLTADELGNWGLTTENGRAHGPHGPGQPFATNTSHPLGHAVFPRPVLPIFRQYYDRRQVQAFGADGVLFLPLGSRQEYPDIAPGDIRAPAKRAYVYSYMVSLTDVTRKKVYDIIRADTSIPESRAYVHVSDSWHPQATSDDYVQPQDYATVMLDSVFAICPKGHSVEQFRIYEAIEAGAIPVMDMAGGYLRDHLPAEYFESPILFLDRWEDLMPTLNRLMTDLEGIRQRQRDLLAWYERYMRWQVRRMEEVLEARANEPASSFCAAA